MKRLMLLLLGMSLVGSAQAESTIKDPEKWYLEDYAVLWADAPWEKGDELTFHSADQVAYHTADGTLSMLDKDWLLAPLQGWRDEGWLNSEVAMIKTDRLHDTLAVFKVRWKDNSDDGSVDYSCAWYQADHLDGGWKLTGYADLDCDAHGL